MLESGYAESESLGKTKGCTKKKQIHMVRIRKVKVMNAA